MPPLSMLNTSAAPELVPALAALAAPVRTAEALLERDAGQLARALDAPLHVVEAFRLEVALQCLPGRGNPLAQCNGSSSSSSSSSSDSDVAPEPFSTAADLCRAQDPVVAAQLLMAHERGALKDDPYRPLTKMTG